VAASNGGRIKASPLARRVARERGIELASVVGTGPDGRIVAEDVERTAIGAPLPAAAAAAAAPVPAAPAVAPLLVAGEGVEVEKLTGIRRTIARRLTEAWAAPAFQISMSADMGRAVALRRQLVAQTPEGAARPTVSDVLTKLVAVALLRHPAVNALWAGDAIHRYPTANVGIAVAIPNGLVVPVIPGAERRTVAEIAAARVDLVDRARAGKLSAEDMQGGTFTISNLGMFGVENFVAVLNPPQVAILAVGAIEERPVARDGQVVIRPMLSLTLTSDHRALDGATAAEFLATVKRFLEEPGLAL
jgi:pyruvate dehydrogenase E2 component (dihydrolipoamide acetyltransferase)